MEYDDFHIVLPSNSREDNSPANYLTCYERAIQLDTSHEWEVGLREISFKNTIKTIHEDSAAVMCEKVHEKPTETAQPLQFSDSTNFEFTLDVAKKGKWTMRGDPIMPWKGILLTKTLMRVNGEESFELRLSDVPDITSEHQTKMVALHRDKAFSFEYRHGFIYLTNHSKFAITLTIPKTVARCMGFLDNQEATYAHEAETCTLDKLLPDQVVKATYKALLATSRKGHKYIMLHPRFKTDPVKYNYTLHYETYTEIKHSASVTPKPGTYTDPKELETELNNDANFATYFTFSYDQRLNRFDIITNTTDTTASLHFKNGLHDILGFTEKVIHANRQKVQKGTLEVNLLRGISSLFIYCDLIQPIHVGSIMAPLLRTVSFNVKQYGEMINAHYTNPIYLPINKSHIDSVGIRIYDVIGQLIPFVEGVTTMILHFRPI